MSDTFRVRAICLHDTQPDVVIDAGESFDTLDAAAAWMNGPDGESFAQSVTIDTETYPGYWLDDVVAIAEVNEDGIVPVDWPERTHTYVTHLQFSARDDEHARRINARIREVITDWQAAIDADQDEPLMILPQGYAIEAAHLTDADDWAEHVDPNEDVCYQCGEPGGTDRLRVGSGNRWCRPCIDKAGRRPYRIDEVLI